MKLVVDRMGQDTEFFLWDKEKEQVIPAHQHFQAKSEASLLAATKESDKYSDPPRNAQQVSLKTRYRVYQSCSDRAPLVFRDGLAVEINTQPTSCRGYYWNNLRHALWLADSTLPEGICWTTRPWVEVLPEMLKDAPEDVLELGCMPTLDAYTERKKSLGEIDPLKLPFRTSGAHLHMSFKTESIWLERYKDGPIPQELWAPFIKAADLLLGVPFTYVFGDELEFKRRKLYGQAGEFRYQQYSPQVDGLEYRVLSSRLYDHPGTGSLFLGIWKFVIGNHAARSLVESSWDKAWEDDICEAINTGNEKALEKALNLSAEMMEKIHAHLVYPGELASVTTSNAVDTWKILREARKRGAMRDMGILDPGLPEGHRGWGFWRDSLSRAGTL